MRVLTSLRLRGVRYELRFTIFIMKVLTLHYDEPFESHGIMAYSIAPILSSLRQKSYRNVAKHIKHAIIALCDK